MLTFRITIAGRRWTAPYPSSQAAAEDAERRFPFAQACAVICLRGRHAQ